MTPAPPPDRHPTLTRPDALIVGEILLAVRQRAFESADDSVRALADRALIPRAVLQGPGG
jgi:hypothetical protein